MSYLIKYSRVKNMKLNTFLPLFVIHFNSLRHSPTYLICLRMSSLCSVYSWSCLAVAVSISACSEFTRSVWLFSRAVFNWPLSISWLWVTIVNSDIKADIFSCNIQKDVQTDCTELLLNKICSRMISNKVC